MTDVAEVIRRAAESMPAPVADPERVRRTVHRRKTRRRITAGGAALIVAAAGLALAFGAFRNAGPNRSTPATEGPVDPTTLRYAWSERIDNGSAVSEVLHDAERIYVPRTTGVVVYPKECSDPCAPLWSLDLVEPAERPSQTPALALGGDVLAVTAGGRLAVVGTDCGSDGQPCQPLWYADPLPGTSGFFGAVIADGVVKVTSNEGNAPDNMHTAVAFDLQCRNDGGECAPLWQAELGSGAAHFPEVALNGIIYQQVGTRMLGLAARCRTDGGLCQPDFAVEAPGDPQTQESTLLGPIVSDGTLVFASGTGQLFAYAEHCGADCRPTWAARISDFLDGYLMAAGELAVVADDGGVTAVPFSCAPDAADGSCRPAWRADLDGYWALAYADENVVVAARRFRDPAAVVALPADCAETCEPLWTARPAGELHGVASDGTSVFVADGRRIAVYPVACGDPCEPVWTDAIDGIAWDFLVDERNVVVPSQPDGSQGLGTPGLGIAVFTGDSMVQDERGDAPRYDIAHVALDEVVTADDGTRSAIVSYEIAWSGNEWPGYAQCRVDVLDARANAVATLEFEFASLRSRSRGTIDVPLSSGVPVTADASCGGAYRPSAAAAYVITNPVVVGTASDPRLVFDVAWATEEPPLYQKCVAELQLPDGSVGTYPFGLSVAPGKGEVLLTPEFAGSDVRSVQCRPVGSGLPD